MDISVVIPSYETQDSIAACLDALAAQRTARSFEVLVVDCSSTERVAQIVANYPKARILRRQARFNPGQGRNLGAQQARGRLLLFVDADVRLAPDALERAGSHRDAGRLVFGGSLELDTLRAADFSSYLEHYFFNHEAQAGRPPGERANLSSALLAIDAQVFSAGGGFRDIPRMQDTELTERLRTGGQRLHFCPDLRGFQTQGAPLSKVLRKIVINGQNLYQIRYRSLLERHAGSTVWARVGFCAVVPAMSTAKGARIIVRHLRHQPLGGKLMTLALAPALMTSASLWGWGLGQATWTGAELSSQRD